MRHLSPKIYVYQLDSGAPNLGKRNRARLMPTDDKETSIFYLKLQWIAAKDEAERKNLGEKIKQLLAKQANQS